MRDQDEAAVADVWHRAGRAAYPYLPGWRQLSLEEARRIVREVIRPSCDVSVATSDGRVVGFLAMKGSYIDRMYVDPDEWRKGWGARLVGHAKRRCPGGLSLHTHQRNRQARAFYERHGFVVAALGVSPSPENEPDVEYRWVP